HGGFRVADRRLVEHVADGELDRRLQPALPVAQELLALTPGAADAVHPEIAADVDGRDAEDELAAGDGRQERNVDARIAPLDVGRGSVAVVPARARAVAVELL